MRITREELYNIYRDLSGRTYDPYSSKFTEANAPYYSGTVKLHIEDMLDALAEANVFDRDSAIPAIKEQPHTRMTIEPMMLGGKKPISALDGQNKQLGQAVIIEGRSIDQSVFEVGKKLSSLRTGIVNSLGKMSGEVLLTSELTHPKLAVNFDPTGISDKGNLTVDTSANETVVAKIVDLLQTFYSDKGFVPQVMIGRKVADQVIQEINLGAGKSAKGDYRMQTTGQNEGFKLEVAHMDVPMELIAPVTPLGSTTKIVTDNLIQLTAVETLCMGYAVIETYNGATEMPEAITGEVAINYGEINKETGRSSIHAKSAPLPVIVDNNLIERYQLVLN
jgi:hypothetical protein